MNIFIEKRIRVAPDEHNTSFGYTDENKALHPNKQFWKYMMTFPIFFVSLTSSVVFALLISVIVAAMYVSYYTDQLTDKLIEHRKEQGNLEDLDFINYTTLKPMFTKNTVFVTDYRYFNA